MAALVALSKAQEFASKGLLIGKAVVFLILLILSIVALATSSKSKSTSEGKSVLGLSVVIFLMTLALPFLKHAHIDSNIKVIGFMMVYWILALVSTILAYKNSDKLQDKDEKAKSDDAKRASTGIVVLVGLYLIGGAVLCNIGDNVSRDWCKDNYFLKP